MNVLHFGFETLKVLPEKKLAKKSPKLGAAATGAAVIAAAPTATSGLGGTNNVESFKANLFMSGWIKKPVLIGMPPLKGCPTTIFG